MGVEKGEYRQAGKEDKVRKRVYCLSVYRLVSQLQTIQQINDTLIQQSRILYPSSENIAIGSALFDAVICKCPLGIFQRGFQVTLYFIH